MADDQPFDWLLEEISNPSLKLLRISKSLQPYDFANQDGLDDFLKNFRSTLTHTVKDIEVASHNEYDKHLDIIADVNIIAVFSEYRTKCFCENSSFILKKLLRWIFFKRIHYIHTDPSKVFNEYIQRDNKPSVKYYQLVSTLLSIYEELVDNIPLSIVDLNSHSKMLLETDTYDLIKDWLIECQSNIKSSAKR